ncbi:MAG: hypothetical protein R2706_15820 [Acidimicrobiales bacterium]
MLATTDPVAAARHHEGDNTVPPAVMVAAASACDVDQAEANGILNRLLLDSVEASELRSLALLSLRLGRPDLNDIIERGLVHARPISMISAHSRVPILSLAVGGGAPANHAVGPATQAVG